METKATNPAFNLSGIGEMRLNQKRKLIFLHLDQLILTLTLLDSKVLLENLSLPQQHIQKNLNPLPLWKMKTKTT